MNPHNNNIQFLCEFVNYDYVFYLAFNFTSNHLKIKDFEFFIHCLVKGYAQELCLPPFRRSE